jgi:predicted ester cyclase
LPELGERRLFIRTPTGILLELVFRDTKAASLPRVTSRPMTNRLSNLGIFAALALLLSTPAFAADGVKINEVVVAASIPDAQRDASINAARAFYDFWNTGDPALLKHAIAPTFTDRTLPPGRPQGPEGPAFASHQFRAAVPDLTVTAEKMIVAGDYVTVHMRFASVRRGVRAKPFPSSPPTSSRSRTAASPTTGISKII